jgi:hypothetical protein
MATRNEMRRWIAAASKEELDLLAEKASTTVGTLRQMAGGYRSGGKAIATASLAYSIELATKDMAHVGLDPVMRGDLCSACAGCDIYRRSRENE